MDKVKIKWPSISTTLLIIVIGLIVFYEARDTLNGYKRNLFIRWFLNNTSNDRCLEVKTYILTDDQVKQMVEHPEKEVEQRSQKTLSEYKQNYIVIRIRNLSEAQFFGTLAYKVFNSFIWNRIDLTIAPQDETEKKAYQDCIFPVRYILLYPEEDDIPRQTLTKWTTLYTTGT